MKYLILFSFILAGLSSFAVETKNCPETFYIGLSQFKAKQEAPEIDLGLPFLAYAQLHVNHMKNMSDTLILTERKSGVCRYQGDFLSSVNINGSFRKGSKKKPKLQFTFEQKYNKETFFYSGFVGIEKLSDQQEIRFARSGGLYYLGNYDHPKESDFRLVKVGQFKAQVENSERANCINETQARSYLKKYAKDQYAGYPKVIAEVVSSLYWGKRQGYYLTQGFNYHKCGPSVSCWDYFIVGCDGEVFKEVGGEE